MRCGADRSSSLGGPDCHRNRSTLIAKIGAVATAFLFPILLDAIGTRLLLYGLIVASVLGALVTWQYRIETAGVNPDRLGEVEPEAKSPGTPAGAHLRAH